LIGKCIELSRCVSAVDEEVLALRIAKVTEALLKRGQIALFALER
jgi:hypothetical protein